MSTARILTGKDYPDLCEACRQAIDLAAELIAVAAEDEYSSEDEYGVNEGPIDYVYDHRLFCGGHECTGG